MKEPLFERSSEYDQMLKQGIQLSGENKEYFAAGRILELKRYLPEELPIRRILDYGCGIGHTTRLLSEAFQKARIVGVDSAMDVLQSAQKLYGSNRVEFISSDKMKDQSTFDFCYCNGVFHHITDVEEQISVLGNIRASLREGGFFALFENNPWNPGTHLVMRRIPFDREAKMITVLKARKLLKQAGFSSIEASRSLFYFPKALAFLRVFESLLGALPFGAQYYLLAKK